MLLYSLCFVINKVFAYLINLYSENRYKFYLKLSRILNQTLNLKSYMV